MGRIAGDGSDIVMMNGRQVRYQGIGHIKKDVSTAQAVEKTANDGYKKYFLESADHKDRLVIYGDRMDFSFEKKQTVPTVMVNGKAYTMVAHDEQDVSWLEGFINGAKQGIATAGSATIDAAKQVISQIGVAGTLAIAGGTTVALIKGIEARAIMTTAGAFAIPALKIVGVVVAIGILVAGVAGGIKGAAEVGGKKHDTKAIASIMDPGEGDSPEPAGSAVTPAPAPAPGASPTSDTPAEPPVTPTPVPDPAQVPSGQSKDKKFHVLVPGDAPSTNATARRLGDALKMLEERQKASTKH